VLKKAFAVVAQRRDQYL